MINFSKIREKHYRVTNCVQDECFDECYTCRNEVWPCEVTEILDEFELFIKKINFNQQIVDSWIKDYAVDNSANCKKCSHPLKQHGKLGCNMGHNTPAWLEIGCSCSITG